MNRIDSRFSELKGKKQSGLIAFISAGDPNIAASLEIMKALPAAGADIIELGIPFSDPMADGPTIQTAGQRALAGGITLAKILRMVKEFRATDKTTPVVLMGYYNPIYRMGCEKFCKEAVAAGVDGVIVVDLPPEEEDELRPFATQNNLHFVRLIAPTTKGERLPMLLQSATGFVYYISVTGITGGKAADAKSIQQRVDEMKKLSSLPIAVGFGIKTPEQAKTFAGIADAVVVGSALVKAVEENQTSPVKAVSALVASLSQAIRSK